MSEEIKDTTSSVGNTSPLKTLAESLGLPYAEKLKEPKPPKDLVRGDFDRLSGSWAKINKIIPIGGDENQVVVATSDPLQTAAIEQIKLCYGRPVRLIVTPEEEVIKSINSIRKNLMSERSGDLTTDDSEEESKFSTELKIDVTDSDDEDAPIIRYVNAIIFNANNERASDVHIEGYEDIVKVRFRVDGALKDVSTADKSFHAAIVSRIKVMSGMNIAEKRLPQDGRIGIKIAGKDVDIRVSTVPTQYGERVVMRLLDQTHTVLELEQIGLLGENLKTVRKLITKPNGIILVTGPTGSGKSTTLYSCLKSINTRDKNILTVEDPVEYELPGIGQMQINSKIDFTFARGLRAILRQDPDIVMVGEIRDLETAEIAIQASLTGHLVLSTLHTNDAASATTRLIDMGIEPFLVSSSLLAVMAQRLVRTLCKDCKVPHKITDEELLELGLTPEKIEDRNVFKANPEGCKECGGNGYRGRQGIHELLVADDDIKSLITQSSDAFTIKNAALKKGFSTLRMDGAEKVLMGMTSVEEVLLRTQEDEG